MRIPLLHALPLVIGLLLPAAAAAQQPDSAQQQDTARNAAERARERLRALRPLAAPDTAVAPDTTRQPPAQVRIQAPGRAARAPAADGGIPRDSVMEALARLEGFIATEYQGEEATFEADSGRLQLLRAASVAREGQRLSADSSVTYNEVTGIACGFGRPTISGTGLDAPLISDTVCYNINARLGVAANAETSIAQGANWRMRGIQFYTVGDTVYSHNALFTDCDLPWEHVHYYFGAREVKVVRNNTLVARNVTLNFADVPVFWLPFMVQSLSRGRRSGLLMPRFGINDIVRNSSRYNRRVEDIGFYWAVNDYMGAEVALDWNSNNYTALRGSFDYSVLSQFLGGGLTFRRFWKEEGGTELTLASRHEWQPNERTRLGASANYSSSTDFVRRRSIDPRELTRSVDSNVNLNRQFNWGSLTLGATRNQYLHDGTVRMTLPSVGVNLAGVTLFSALPGEERFYSNASWTASADSRVETQSVGANSSNLSAQDRRTVSGRVSSRFSMGRLGFDQSLTVNDDQRDPRTIVLEDTDSTRVLPGATERRLQWNAGLNFQQRLIGTSTFTPGLRVRGEMLRNDSTGDAMVNAPMRLDFTAALQTDLYGFWPGIGPLSRIRHRMSPSFNYTYSPAPKPDSLQQAVFRSLGTIREQNTLSIGLSQTFEGKRRRAERADAAADSLAVADSIAAVAAADTSTGPRRMPPADKPVILLSLSTSAVVYDFVAARDSSGIQTQQITNTVQSDLFRNLQLRLTHDLFRRDGVTDSTAGERVFAPHLSSVTASLSLNSDSWLFRVLRLGGRRTMPESKGEPGTETDTESEAGPAIDRTKPELGMIGSSRRDPIGSAAGPVGSWNASLNYTLQRPRTATSGQRENQNITGAMSFQPTPNWTVRWNTGYNFTLSEFTDHILTLTRRLHDWDANFDFVKAQNGNFSFQFRVHLRANPDVKLDYEQQDLEAVELGRVR
ncbi:MAG TPA: putative LPS assembly protein LptD [Longimicrobiales bacterium]|nr:putative LPS assembly protein LptD [Longimicrobiales bacterium]